mgnify:CR=1 FL=1
MRFLITLTFLLLSLEVFSFADVYYVRGNAFKTREGLKEPLRKGLRIQSLDKITVESNSLVILNFDNTSKIKIDENSTLVFDKSDFEEEGDTGPHYIIDLLKGSTLMKFNKGANETIVLKNNKIALGVRGTTFFFGESDGDSYAHVKDGSVDVFKEDFDHENIKSGQGIVVEKGQLTKPTEYEWGKNLDWNLDKGAKTTKFQKEEFRRKRKSEIQKKIKKQRSRRKKILKSKIRKRVEKHREIKRKMKRKMKGKVKDIKKRKAQKMGLEGRNNTKVTPQEFRKKLRKRMRRGRRRN